MKTFRISGTTNAARAFNFPEKYALPIWQGSSYKNNK